jgi:hypothetical protein
MYRHWKGHVNIFVSKISVNRITKRYMSHFAMYYDGLTSFIQIERENILPLWRVIVSVLTYKVKRSNSYTGTQIKAN